VGTSSSTAGSWGVDGQANLVHRNLCKICKEYALHVYNHAFDRDTEYLDAKERRDLDIAAGEISRANRRYDQYEDEIDMLRGQIRRLQQQLDDQDEGRQHKKARMRKSSRSPERPQGNNYASAAAQPAPYNPAPAATWPVAPPPAPRPVDSGRDVVMKEAYPPLPKLPPPKYQASVPGYTRSANWNPAPLPPGSIPSAIPQNAEEFDIWARSAHIAGNYQMLHRVREYVRYANEIASGARSPLMNHALANWRLPSWLPEEQQSARGLRRLKDPNRLEQPGLTDPPERWAQFMHRHLYQWQNSPGALMDSHRVSLPHVRGQLLTRQQVPSGLSQRQKFGLYLRLMEVFAMPGLYRQTRERHGLLVPETRRRLTMSNISDNTTVEEVVRHLAAMGVSDDEVREAHHYAVGWLTAMASTTSTRPDEPAAASDILNRLRQTPNHIPGDAPLMTEPRWWIPSASDVSLRAPRPRRNVNSAVPRRGAAPIRSERPLPEFTSSYPISSGYLGETSASMHAGPSRVDNPLPAVAGPSTTAHTACPPQGNDSLEADPTGGWANFPFPIKASRAQKKAIKTQRRVESGIPPRGFGGAASDNRFRTFARPTRRRRGGEESEGTDSVSETDDEKPVAESQRQNADPLEEDQSVETPALGLPPVTPVSQAPSLPSDNEAAISHAEPFVPEHERPISLSPTITPMLLDSDIADPPSKADE